MAYQFKVKILILNKLMLFDNVFLMSDHINLCISKEIILMLNMDNRIGSFPQNARQSRVEAARACMHAQCAIRVIISSDIRCLII